MDKEKIIKVFKVWQEEDLMSEEEASLIPPDNLAEIRATEFIRLYQNVV